MRSLDPISRRLPWRRSLSTVLVIFGAICVITLVLNFISMEVQSSVRAYVAGEGMWSRGQREATRLLQLYGSTRNPEYLRRYQAALDIPLGYRQARLELLKPDYDKRVVRQGLLQGQTDAEDIPGVILLFRCCSGFPKFQESLRLWAIGDEYILRMQALGIALKDQIESADPSEERIEFLLQELEIVDEEAQSYARQFTQTLGSAARDIVDSLFYFTVAVAVLLIMLGTLISLQILRGLRQSEQQYRALFNTADDAVFVFRRSDGRILEANPAAEALTRKPLPQLLTLSFAQCFGDERDGPPAQRYVEGKYLAQLHAGGDGVPVEIGGSFINWKGQNAYLAIARDISDRLRHEEQQRLASQAMENMLEGVVIFNADWRIVSVNHAFTAITHFSAEEVLNRPMPLPMIRRSDKAFYRSLVRTVRRTEKWQGEAYLQNKFGAIYPIHLSMSIVRDQRGQVSHYVAVFSDISRSKEYEMRLHQLAHYDQLTHLPNRAYFNMHCAQAVEDALRRRSRLALLFIDLDGFKLVNDTYGHATGDYLLQTVASRIHACLRQDDFVARLAGDEFTVLLQNVAQPEDAALLAHKLLHELSETITFEGKDITIFASIGISFLPDNARDPQTLLTHADTAMYEAKHRGRNTYQIFMPWMVADTSSRLQLSNSLKYAIARNQLELHYQPCLRIGTGEIASLEALIRWRHPELGLVSPDVFIPLAEEIGLISHITDWVLRTACRQGMQWLEKGLAPVQLDVNISPCNFWDASLPATIGRVLKDTGWQADWLCLEITETAMANQEKSKAMLQELHTMGMRLAIDDFGIGYSSLSYLKDFPVHYLKIDRSFTASSLHSDSNAAITRAIIAVAKGLKLHVIAEGVETQAQEAFLLAEGCDQVQGYLFGRPMPPQQLEPILARNQQAHHVH